MLKHCLYHLDGIEFCPQWMNYLVSEDLIVSLAVNTDDPSPTIYIKREFTQLQSVLHHHYICT